MKKVKKEIKKKKRINKVFPKNILASEMKKCQIFMNKPFYLGLSILNLSKTVMYEF